MDKSIVFVKTGSRLAIQHLLAKQPGTVLEKMPGLLMPIINECQEVGNVAMVARRHDVFPNTIHGWIRNNRKNGSVKRLPKQKDIRMTELERRIELISTENNQLKNIVIEKELELAVLRELRDQVNPR